MNNLNIDTTYFSFSYVANKKVIFWNWKGLNVKFPCFCLVGLKAWYLPTYVKRPYKTFYHGRESDYFCAVRRTLQTYLTPDAAHKITHLSHCGKMFRTAAWHKYDGPISSSQPNQIRSKITFSVHGHIHIFSKILLIFNIQRSKHLFCG